MLALKIALCKALFLAKALFRVLKKALFLELLAVQNLTLVKSTNKYFDSLSTGRNSTSGLADVSGKTTASPSLAASAAK